MIRTEADKGTQLLTVAYSGDVSSEELQGRLEQIKSLVAEMDPGFRLLTDLSMLSSMETACAPLHAQVMEAANKRGVSEVVRVVPDPRKDIGFTLMSRFHYDHRVRLLTYESLEDALQSLAS